jgi:hypothetical protein
VSTAKRIILHISAYIGWGATIAILAGTFLEAEIVTDRSSFFGRLFALLALVAAVITLGLWNEQARARNVIPVEEAWRVGANYGANYARVMANLARLTGVDLSDMPRPETMDWDTFLQTPIDPSNQQQSPPVRYPRRG